MLYPARETVGHARKQPHMDTPRELIRTCANCACFAEVQATPPRYMCRFDPVNVVQQVRQGQVMTTGRGQSETTVEMGLAYRPTLPHLVCYGHWRPRGMPPGEDIQTSPSIARALIESLHVDPN